MSHMLALEFLAARDATNAHDARCSDLY